MIGSQGVDRVQGRLLVGAGAFVERRGNVGSKLTGSEDVAGWAVAARDDLAPLTGGCVATAHAAANLGRAAPHELCEMADAGQVDEGLWRVGACEVLPMGSDTHRCLPANTHIYTRSTHKPITLVRRWAWQSCTWRVRCTRVGRQMRSPLTQSQGPRMRTSFRPALDGC